MCIKSTYGEDRTKALFCLYLTTGELNCFLYDVNADYSTLHYTRNYDYSKTEFYALKVYYFPEQVKYGLSCITNTGKLQTIIFNEEL